MQSDLGLCLLKWKHKLWRMAEQCSAVLSMAQGEEGHLELSAFHRLERCVKAGAWCQYVPVPNSCPGAPGTREKYLSSSRSKALPFMIFEFPSSLFLRKPADRLGKVVLANEVSIRGSGGWSWRMAPKFRN